MVGTRMDNQIEGLRGWGVPSEAIFEVNSHVPFRLFMFISFRCSPYQVWRERNSFTLKNLLHMPKCNGGFGVLHFLIANRRKA
jgi:hypothetical protein